MKLSTLKRQAQQATTWRGHSMKWGPIFGGATTNHGSQFGTCRNCGAEVLLTEHPAPNGIDIGGAAVALNCVKWVAA